MTDPSSINLPGNSKFAPKSAGPQPPREKVESIVQGKVSLKKPSLWDKTRETFIGDDAKSVGTFILLDVVVPQIKKLIYDSFTQGLEKSLFGTAGVRVDGRDRVAKRHTSYNRMYNNAPERREMSTRARASHDFDEIVLETRVEAEQVIDRLVDLIDKYGVASVMDLYDLCGQSSEYVDNKWGWKNLRTAAVARVRGGYLLDLPAPEVIE